MTRRGRSPGVKCAVGSSCNSLHSPDNPQGTLPCDYLPLSPSHPAKPCSSVSYRPIEPFGAESSRYVGLNMEVNPTRDNESVLYSKQPSPRESPRFPPRLVKKDVVFAPQKLSEADKMERVRAEARARISKAIKVRDDALSYKQQAAADDDDAGRAMALPRQGPSMTREPKKEWSYARRLADDWERDSPLACPMKLPWNDHCLCYDCTFVSQGAGRRTGVVFARGGIPPPKDKRRLEKKAADAPSAKQAAAPGTEGARPSPVINDEVIKPGLREAMCHAPTANNSAESLPKLARVAANLSPAAQQAKQKEEEERRAAASGKDAPPPATDESKDDDVTASKEREKQQRERRRETLRKFAIDNVELMKSSPRWEYQSIRTSELQALRDELKESKEKLAIVKEILGQDPEGLKNLIDMMRRRGKSCNQPDEEHEKTNKDVATPTSKIESQAPAQTTMNLQSSPPTTPTIPTANLTETLLLAISIADLTARLIMLPTFWYYHYHASPHVHTIQTTIVWITPVVMILACLRSAWFTPRRTGRGGAQSQRIMGMVDQIDMAALGVGGLLFVSFVVEVWLLLLLGEV